MRKGRVLLVATVLIGGAFALNALTSNGPEQTTPAQPTPTQSVPVQSTPAQPGLPSSQSPVAVAGQRAHRDTDDHKFAGAFVCLQNSNFTGGVWSHSPCLDPAGMSIDEAYSYLAPAHGVEGLTSMNDPEAPAVRYAGTMPNGTRIWWVNLGGAALNEGADQNHPLECKDVSDKAYFCQWIPTANPKEWANYQRMQMDNVSDFPSFFNVMKVSVERYSAIAALAQHHNDAITAGQATSNQTADWYYKDGNEDGAECHALSGTPRQFAVAAVRRGATNLETTGSDILGADVVISYGLKDKSCSYSFYKSHEKCANPLDTADNTKSDFSRNGHAVDADQDKADQTLADEALKHAADKGPWWVSDGAKIWAGCKLSKFTPMGDAVSAKAKGARNNEIEGVLRAANVSHPTDVVVKYDLDGKSFYNDYYTNKFCDDSDPPSQTDKVKAISVSSRNGESWYVDYYSNKIQCVETKRTPKELADDAKRHDAIDIEFSVPSSDNEKTFLYLQYGVGDQGHMIGFYKTRDACTNAINN